MTIFIVLLLAVSFCPSTPTTNIHNRPACLNAPGGASSRDISAAITHDHIHHVFQLCAKGWHHSTSTDLVHWTHRGIGLHEWPSGFVVVDPYTHELCAGFRGSGGSTSSTSSTSSASLVLRCAVDDHNTTSTQPLAWSTPETMLNVTFWRFLPLDPFRPFQDTDGQWYVGVALDACNATHFGQNKTTTVCTTGGQIDLWTSPVLRGNHAKWRRTTTPMFTSNTTLFGKTRQPHGEPHEFVTVDFLGRLPSTDDGATNAKPLTLPLPPNDDYRVFFNNPYYARGSTSFFVGHQHDGAAFTPLYESMLDWSEFHLMEVPGNKTGLEALNMSKNNPSGGRLGMTRTLGSDQGNRVTGGGRRVAVGWVSASDNMFSNPPTSLNVQSLPRDLSFHGNQTNSPPQLYQAFVPELKTLRKPETQRTITTFNSISYGLGQHIELSATFHSDDGFPDQFGLEVFKGQHESTSIVVYSKYQVVCINGTLQGAVTLRCGPLYPNSDVHSFPNKKVVSMHVYLDHILVEVIVNNITAITASVNPSGMADGIGLMGDNATMRGEVTAWRLAGIEREWE